MYDPYQNRDPLKAHFLIEIDVRETYNCRRSFPDASNAEMFRINVSHKGFTGCPKKKDTVTLSHNF